MRAITPTLMGGALNCVATIHWPYWLAWGGSFVLSVVLVFLLWTRWGQSKLIHKCAAMSLIVHLILVFLTMTVRIVSGDGASGGGGGPPIHVRIVEDKGAPIAAIAANAPVVSTEIKSEVTAPPLLTPPPPEPEVAMPVVEDTKPKIEPKVAEKAAEKPPEPTPAAAVKHDAVQPPATADVAVPPKHVAEKSETPPQTTAEPVAPPPPTTTTAATTAASPVTGVATVNIAAAVAGSASNVYALRNASGRDSLVAGQGGNSETEAAVTAALRWLAATQARDGRWDALQYGAGKEEMVLGQNRGGAGRGADTGVTALALLAFLGAGHSHLQGQYRDNVRHGLDFLLRSQAPDGSIFGDATLYAQMYCHSMATFALAEAQAMTGDARLKAAVTKAVNFSVAAQNTSTGGWRYRPGDMGDTSQLGWQVMALASAERAGIRVPDQTWSRVERFLQSVRRGDHGGLASYRADSPASTSMTAEALYCRLVLQQAVGTNLVERAADEASTELLATPPTAERVNLYYWYYATLALHHRQLANEKATAAWRTWNDAMIAALKQTQVASGDDAGSWNSNTLWGGYGGRVYTTAMAAMCLEVYYRYAPAPAPTAPQTATRPTWHPAIR